MLNIVRIVIAFSLLITLNSQAQTLKTYNISGNNASELIASMKANSPNGYWAHAYNHWQYSYRFTKSKAYFTLSSLEITRTVEITMPNWPGYKAATKCRQKNWNSMYRSLRNHEDTHVRLADPVEALLREAITNIPPTDSKIALAAAIKEAAKTVFDENKLLQSQYDLETGHGKSDSTDPVILKSCP
jgi:predicted secreted Zn-dependent protease